MLAGDSQTRLEVISCSCCLSKRRYTLPVGRHSTAKEQDCVIVFQDWGTTVLSQGPTATGTNPWMLLAALPVSISWGNSWVTHPHDIIYVLDHEMLSGFQVYICAPTGWHLPTRPRFDCSPALLHSGFQTEKTHGYREGSNMLLSKSSGLLSNQNPGDTVAFPTEEDLMQVPRNKSMQIT